MKWQNMAMPSNVSPCKMDSMSESMFSDVICSWREVAHSTIENLRLYSTAENLPLKPVSDFCFTAMLVRKMAM